jgi:Asp-tRNA(Asn)/Glu-tRNA(Gln) amidotransferase C subunit
VADDVTAADVERLAALVGLRIPPEDVEPLRRSLAAHAELVAPLLSRDLSDVQPALRFLPDADA